MEIKGDAAICYVGMPRVREAGIDVLSFHVHRYVFGWLRLHGCDSVLITVGFEKSACESVTLAVRADEARVVRVGWSFGDLLELWQSGSRQLTLEPVGGAGDAIVYDLVPVFDDTLDSKAAGIGPGVLAFGLLLNAGRLSEQAIQRLQLPVAESIRAARRNAVRMFMEEHSVQEMKSYLYEFMDRLPEWTGCDCAASFILASNLEAMTVIDGNTKDRVHAENVDKACLDVLAERLYRDPAEGSTERLVGMSVLLGGDAGGVFRAVLEQHRRFPQIPFHVLVRADSDGKGAGEWRLLEDTSGRTFKGFYRVGGRGDEQMMVLLPLIVEESGESELLGFVCLAYREEMKLLASFSRLAMEMREQLAAALRYSPLYTLRARKLWILSQLRKVLEREVVADGDGFEERHTRLIGKVSELLAREVEIPSFAIGYIRRQKKEDGKRVLTYAHPHGWSQFQEVSLEVDVAREERIDSGVSALAVRLGRPLVLAGGHGQGEALEFRNYLYVCEENGRLLDARGVQAEAVAGVDLQDVHAAEAQGWVRLSRYYKPARESTYATLAFPITYAGTAFGVLTLEVEKDTDWLWWTGFGSKFFWELVVTDLAAAFYELRERA